MNIILKFINKIIKIISREKYSIVDVNKYKLYEHDRFMIIPKGRYLLSKREDIDYDIINDFTNDVSTYDYIWDSNKFIESYVEKERIKLYNSVINIFINSIDNLSNKKNKVIDVGVGSGDFYKILSRFSNKNNINIEFNGVDFSNSSIKRCQSIIPEGFFKVDDIHSLSFADNSFDTVFCLEVLEHIQFVDQAIKELKRICRKKGFIIITIPNGLLDSWSGHINFWSEKDFTKIIVNQKLKIKSFSFIENGKTMLFCIEK